MTRKNAAAVQPTMAAVQAFEIAERILSDTRGLSRQMRDFAQVRVGRVVLLAFRRCGVGADAARTGRISFVASRHRGRVARCRCGQFLSDILTSDGEFGIGCVQGDVMNAITESLLRGRLSAIGLAAGGFGTRRHLTWDELSALSTIAMRRDTLICAQIDETLGRQGKRLTPTFEVSLINTALSMTAQGLGYSILPSYMLPAEQFPGLVAKPLIRPAITRQISLVRRAGRSLSPATQCFIDLARATLKRNDPIL